MDIKKISSLLLVAVMSFSLRAPILPGTAAAAAARPSSRPTRGLRQPYMPSAAMPVTPKRPLDDVTTRPSSSRPTRGLRQPYMPSAAMPVTPKRPLDDVTESSSHKLASGSDAATPVVVPIRKHHASLDIVIEHLKGAKKSIVAKINGITNEDIQNALIERARKGISVLLLVDQQFCHTKPYRDFRKKVWHLQNTEEISEENFIIEEVYESDSIIMHDKLAVIDNEIVIHGSVNWNNVNPDNIELVIVTTRIQDGTYVEEVVTPINLEFTGKNPRLAANARLLYSQYIAQCPAKEQAHYCSLAQGYDLSDVEKDFLNLAQHTIVCKIFSMTDMAVAMLLALAVEQGLQVHIIFDVRTLKQAAVKSMVKRMASKKRSCRGNAHFYLLKDHADFLKDRSRTEYPKENMHEKMMLADKSHVLFGSGNVIIFDKGSDDSFTVSNRQEHLTAIIDKLAAEGLVFDQTGNDLILRPGHNNQRYQEVSAADIIKFGNDTRQFTDPARH